MKTFIVLDLVEGVNDLTGVDGFDICDNQSSLFLGDNGKFVLVLRHQFIGIHADYEMLTQIPGIVEKIQVSDMEHIVDALCITYLVFFHISQCFFLFLRSL